VENKMKMKPFTPEQAAIHSCALAVSSNYLKLEFEMIDVLSDAERTKVFQRLGYPSLFRYAVDCLGLSEAISYALISIARKSKEVPQLKTSGLSVSKASRIVSILDRGNARELIRFAKNHTSKQIDAEVARRNPKAALPDRIKMISGDAAQLSVTVSREFLEMLKRVEALEARSGSRGAGAALEAALKVYLQHKDPVAKAQRAQQRKAKDLVKKRETGPRRFKIREKEVQVEPEVELCARRVGDENRSDSQRIPLTADQKHAVFARDKGLCTVCGSDRWVEIHHVQPVSQGGSNDPENLTTLCGFHHSLVHEDDFFSVKPRNKNSAPHQDS
jgi:5-methylcytosine-specific restriction endonuclease McrA